MRRTARMTAAVLLAVLCLPLLAAAPAIPELEFQVCNVYPSIGYEGTLVVDGVFVSRSAGYIPTVRLVDLQVEGLGAQGSRSYRHEYAAVPVMLDAGETKEWRFYLFDTGCIEFKEWRVVADIAK